MHRNWKLGFAMPVLIAIMACSLVQPGASPQGNVPVSTATSLQAATSPPPVEIPATPAGTAVTFPGGGLVIPAGLASGASSEEVPEAAAQESAPGWAVAPAHVKITLQGYALQGKFHEPQIVIYPAPEYAAQNESAAENLRRLRNVLASPSSPADDESLPQVPFFNAGAVFNAQTAVIPFVEGQGVRTLTEYAQYVAPVNNNELFYHFQGLTNDGNTYVVAILPVTAPLLAADSEPSSMPPAGGVAFPGYETIDPALFEAYYQSVTGLLNGTSPEQFQPALTSLDALIQSLEVSP